MSDLIEKQCKTCSHWQGTICEFRPWPTGEACADWEEGKPMSDLIDRQTAITTLLKAYPLIQKDRLVEVMETVPGTETGDCISRQAAIDAVSEGCQEWRGIFERCKEKLLALPSAQLRKKGKWIDLKCNQCGQVDMSKPNFRPNCGAEMDEVEE